MNIESKKKFINWLQEILKVETTMGTSFILKNFALWNNKQVDIPFKIVKKNVGGNFYLDERQFLLIQIPFQDRWIEVISSKNNEGIVSELLLEGIGKLRNLVACFEISKKVALDEKSSIIDYENLIPHIQHNLPQFENNEKTTLSVKLTGSIFSSKIGCCKLITVWQTEIIKEEARTRTGEGYKFYIREYSKKYSIFFDNCLIEDEYLISFLPMDTFETKTDHIPSYIPKTISYSSNIDKKATEEIRERYDALEHYKYLLTQGRTKKETDLEIFSSI